MRNLTCSTHVNQPLPAGLSNRFNRLQYPGGGGEHISEPVRSVQQICSISLAGQISLMAGKDFRSHALD